MRFLIGLMLIVGVSTTSLSQLRVEDEEHFTELMEKYDIPGLSIAIVDGYELVYANAFGVKDSRFNDEISINTPFQAASLSKSITAALLLRMQEQGILNLDTSINFYLEDWKLKPTKTDFTIPTSRQLLSHTGGTNVHGYLGYLNTKERIPSIEMVLGNSGSSHFWESKVKIQKQPGSGFQYSGGGYSTLQKAIQDLTNRPFHQLILEEVLIPCEMTSSFTDINLTTQQKSTIAYGHNKKGKPVKTGYRTYPESAAAGLWTTPRDLARFLIEIMKSIKQEGRFLTKESSNEMIQAQEMNDGSFSNYGLGFGLRKDESGQVRFLQHSGSNWGFACKMYADLATGDAVVIMINRHKMALWPFTDVIFERIDFEY